jgi:hypothetical protein
MTDDEPPMERQTFRKGEGIQWIHDFSVRQLAQQQEPFTYGSAPMIVCSNRSCARMHGWRRVLYEPWECEVLACSLRIHAWNADGRFWDLRDWVKGYVMLLVHMPWLEPLRGVFRLFSRTLVYPRYRYAKTSSEERTEKAAGTYDGPFHK